MYLDREPRFGVRTVFLAGLNAFVVLAGIGWAPVAQADTVPITYGSIFYDDFTYPAGTLSAGGKWDSVSGTVTLDGVTNATPNQDFLGYHHGYSKLLDFSSAPDDWVAEVRFQVPQGAKLNTQPSGSYIRQYYLFTGVKAAVSEIAGFDLRLQEIAGDSGGTAAQFDMTWYGFDATSNTRVPAAISGGSGLNKGQFYTVTLQRQDNAVDIWLDGTYIDSKTLIDSVNPGHFRFGDGSNLVEGSVTFDYFSIGVPEPGTGLLLLSAVACALLLRRRRT